jgi:hypothetical protein
LKEKNAMALNNKKEGELFQIGFDKNKTEIDKLKSEITNKEKEVIYETYITEGRRNRRKARQRPRF